MSSNLHTADCGPPFLRVLAGLRGVTLACACVAMVGCDGSSDGSELKKINGSVHVVAGHVPRVAETINGSIDIDDKAAVSVANTVNGRIRLGAHATADTVHTVNGDVWIGPGAHVTKGAASVNGGLILSAGAEVLGGVGNVNGNIDVTAAHVSGGISLVNGNLTILGASHVEGGIQVPKFAPGAQTDRIPRIVIGPGVSVDGPLTFERAVKLYVSDQATIGPVTGASPAAYTGDTPPAT